MSTKDEMIADVIEEMAREGEEGITAATSAAIDQAIRHYETMPWWFLETRTTITSSSSEQYYAVPSDFQDLDSITITVSNHTYPLNRRNYSLLEDWFVASSTFIGYPTDYALYGDEIRLYPVPNGAYPMTLSYRQKLGAPSASGSNAWTTDAEFLIRSRAAWNMYSLRYRDTEAAALTKAAETEAFRELNRQNIGRVTTGQPRKRRV